MVVMRQLTCALAVSIVAIAVVSSVPSPASAQNVTVMVNGQQISFDQPPIERSGRVFVPLRGVFEQLGATVVYDNGVINATGDGRTINLHIGSNVALVNGSQQLLDVAPFLEGARTLVPLRFVSQALGAYVDWNNNTSTVTVSMSGAPQSTSAPYSSVTLTNMHPAPNSVVQAKRPAVSGGFSRAVDPNSVRIALDGRDVSSTTYVSATTFLFSSPYDLSATQHEVGVTGKDVDGNAFDQSWSFTSGTNSSQNSISYVAPADGMTVGGSFTVSGTTLPYSVVHLVAVATANMGGYFAVNTGSYDADVTADPYGHFSQAVTINVVGGGDIGVRITSVAPTTNAAATVTMHYHA
jgi:hypothetical protein